MRLRRKFPRLPFTPRALPRNFRIPINANLREEGNISCRRYRNEAPETLELAKGNIIDGMRSTITIQFDVIESLIYI